MKNYKSLLPKIKTFIFDVDGVLTDGKFMITTEGELLRSFDTKDGYAMKCALIKGYKIAIISGGEQMKEYVSDLKNLVFLIFI